MKYNFSSITLNITQGCNLRCKYCQVDKNPETMSQETLVKTLDWISENVNNPFVSFFGGEPMLEYERIKWAIENYPNIKFGLSTNLTLLTPEKIKFFFDHKTRFLFSVDGIGEIHNKNRDNSWDKIAQFLPILGELFSDAVFRITITPENVSHLCETIWTGSKLGFKNFHFLPDGIDEGWSPESYAELKRQIFALWQDPDLRPKVRTFADYAWRLHGSHNEFQCCDGKTAISILPNGQFSLCGEQTKDPDFIVGDLDRGIDETKVQAFWDKIKPCPIHCKANPICSKERCFSRRKFEKNDLSERIKSHCRFYNIIEEAINSEN